MPKRLPKLCSVCPKCRLRHTPIEPVHIDGRVVARSNESCYLELTEFGKETARQFVRLSPNFKNRPMNTMVLFEALEHLV